MCRHVGYLGPAVSLHELLWSPEHSLLQQSWAPNDMRGGGTSNADGFGIGWYEAGSATPARYRNAGPMWTDVSFAEVARRTRSTAVLGAVRSATPGMPVVPTACAPFVDAPWLFSHNGVVTGWPDSLVQLASELPVAELMTLDAPTDSAALWALLRRRLRDGHDPVAAVRELAEQVLAAAPESRLNLLLTDGSRMVATACSHALAVRCDGDALTVASEPFGTGPGWEPVPDRHLLVADRGGVQFTPLQAGPAFAGIGGNTTNEGVA